MKAPEVMHSGRGFTVAFMGLDGTGKSTQAQRLSERGAPGGRKWVTVHHSSTKLPVIGGLKRRFHGRAIRMLKRRHVHAEWRDGRQQLAKGKSWVGWALGWYILLGSLLKALWYRLRYRSTYVILDRCFLDDVVKVQWRLGCGSRLSDLFLQLSPKPDVVIVLEGNPAITYSRKKDQNCTYDEYLGKGKILDRWLEEAVTRGWRVRRTDIDAKTIDEVHESALQILDSWGILADGYDTRLGRPSSTYGDERR